MLENAQTTQFSPFSGGFVCLFTFIMCIGPIGVLPTTNKEKLTPASKPAFLYWDF